jgi:hypothetical protein
MKDRDALSMGKGVFSGYNTESLTECHAFYTLKTF